jgi:hypothetical protein
LNCSHCNKYLQYLIFQPNANRETRHASSPAVISGDDPRGPRSVGEQSVAPGWEMRIWARRRDRDELLDGEFPNVRLQLLDGGRSRQRNPEPDLDRRCPFRPPSSGAPFGKAPTQPSGGSADLGRWRPLRPPSSGAPFGEAPAQPSGGDDAPFGLLHPVPPSAKLQHNQAAARILGDGTPFGLGDPTVVGGCEMQVAAAGLCGAEL